MPQTSYSDNPQLPLGGLLLRRKIDQGRALMGMGMGLANPQLFELAPNWDWFFIDAQHGQYTYDKILNCVRVADMLGVPAMVRIAGHDYSHIGPALDTGAAGVIVPMIHSAAEARAIVNAAKYPPLGHRSAIGIRPVIRYGHRYISQANEDILLIGQIESAKGFENAEDIASVPGIDGLFLGTMDYALDAGIEISGINDASDPRSWQAAQAIADICRKRGIISSAYAGPLHAAHRLAAMGYQMLLASLDFVLFKTAAAEYLAKLHSASENS